MSRSPRKINIMDSIPQISNVPMFKLDGGLGHNNKNEYSPQIINTGR